MKAAILETMVSDTVHPKLSIVQLMKEKNPSTEKMEIEQAFHRLLEEGKLRPKYDGLTLVGFFKVNQ